MVRFSHSIQAKRHFRSDDGQQFFAGNCRLFVSLALSDLAIITCETPHTTAFANQHLLAFFSTLSNQPMGEFAQRMTILNAERRFDELAQQL
ncbi:MAG: hypothetical protein JNK38_10980 [Acidobacteria bacterium]|nr:hypothetical protein [Acidobacteriota bacterium]